MQAELQLGFGLNPRFAVIPTKPEPAPVVPSGRGQFASTKLLGCFLQPCLQQKILLCSNSHRRNC
jgi:hypothetical protein